jgi:hypothetical protein
MGQPGAEAKPHGRCLGDGGAEELDGLLLGHRLEPPAEEADADGQAAVRAVKGSADDGELRLELLVGELSRA